MIKSEIVNDGNVINFLKELKDLSEIRGKKQIEFMTSCCKALLTTKGAMRNRAFEGTQDPITGKKWKGVSVKWWIIKRELGLNPDSTLRFGFKAKKGASNKTTLNKKDIRSRYININTKGVMYDNINFKVVGGNGFVGTNIPYAKRHNQGQGKTPQRRFLGVGKPDYKFFQRIIKRMLLKMEKDNKI